MSIVKLVDFILEQSDKRAQEKKMKKWKVEQEQAQQQKEKADAEFSAKARLLQPKFENSEFCDLIVKLILNNYYPPTADATKHITLYDHYIFVSGKCFYFHSLGYNRLEGDVALMACAYAIQCKLKQHWPNNTCIEVNYRNGYTVDPSYVWISAWIAEPLKNIY